METFSKSKVLVLLEDWLDLEYYQAKFDKLLSFA